MRISDWSSDVCSSDLIPYLMLISLASLLGGILNSLEKFWVNAAAPILLNVAMIVALPFFHGDNPYETAQAQAISVSVGGALQLGWLMLARSEEHTSELQSLMRISYAVFCLKKTNKHK